MERERLFETGRWAPLWALLVAAGLGGGVVGIAIVIDHLPEVFDAAAQTMGGAMHDAAQVARMGR